MNFESRCHAQLTYTSHEEIPVVAQLATVKKNAFSKVSKEIPELAEFMEGFLGPSWTISSECILEAGHKGPHSVVTSWVDPTKVSK